MRVLPPVKTWIMYNVMIILAISRCCDEGPYSSCSKLSDAEDDSRTDMIW